MKKSLMIMNLLLCSVFMLTGCGNNAGEVDDSKLSVYEIHQYDAEFKHTEEIVAKFDFSVEDIALDEEEKEFSDGEIRKLTNFLTSFPSLNNSETNALSKLLDTFNCSSIIVDFI